jgi:hypothetical protein
VHERGDVDELDDCGSSHQVGRDLARPAPTAEKHQRGPDPFAGRVDATIDHRTDFGFERRQLPVQKPVELRHVRRKHREDAGEGV